MLLAFRGSDQTTNAPAGAVAVADFNGDGRLDIAAPFTRSVVVLMNLGGGRFSQSAVIPINPLGPRSISSGDFNGDTFVDLAMPVSGDRSVRLLANDGTGRFVLSTPLAILRYDPFRHMAVDLDSDGDLDLVVLTGSSNPSFGDVEVLLNDGQGVFRHLPPRPLMYYAPTLDIADLDRDGHPDLVVGNYVPPGTYGRLALFRGRGDGTFGPEELLRETLGVPTPRLADLDGDGDLDVAYSNYDPMMVNGPTSTVTLLTNDGSGGFVHSGEVPTAESRPTGLLVRDLNRDGFPDLAVGYRLGFDLQINYQRPDGGFTAPQVFNAFGPDELAAADLDGDGYSDLVFGTTFAYWDIRISFHSGADVDLDGQRTIADIFEFLDRWFQGDERADLDHNGFVGVSDLFRLLNTWIAGCR